MSDLNVEEDIEEKEFEAGISESVQGSSKKESGDQTLRPRLRRNPCSKFLVPEIRKLGQGNSNCCVPACSSKVQN